MEQSTAPFPKPEEYQKLRIGAWEINESEQDANVEESESDEEHSNKVRASADEDGSERENSDKLRDSTEKYSSEDLLIGGILIKNLT